MRGMSTPCAGGLEVVIQSLAVGWVYAVVDNCTGALSWGQAAKVGQALLCYEDVDVVLGVIDVADHGHDAGDGAALGDRLGDKDRQVGVTGEVPGAADAVQDRKSTRLGGVDVTV